MKVRKEVRGFTLIELLVVISIIGILAGMLLPALTKAKLAAQKRTAQTEIKGLESAINQYYTDNSRYPTAQKTRKEGVTTANPDYTYGTWGTSTTNTLPFTHKSAKAPTSVPAEPNYSTVLANNSEVVGILMNVKEWQNNRPPGNTENRSGRVYLNAKFVQGSTSAGVGMDGVYRDPWGSPYIITLDLNYDNAARDAVYRKEAVNEDATRKNITGLFKAGRDAYEVKSGVMVWSFGPDRMASHLVGAKTGVNKDNILSWE